MYNFQHSAWHIVSAQKISAITAKESEPLALYFSGIVSSLTAPIN